MKLIPREKIEKICSEINGEYGLYLSIPDEQEVFEINSNAVFNSASTIKIPLLALLFSDFESGRLNPEQTTKILDNCRVGGSGVLKFLSDETTTLSIFDFATLMIIYSDNIATNVIIDILGKDRANAFIRENGWTNTYVDGKFLGRLIGEGAVFNRTSAHDLGDMMERILLGTLVSPTASEGMLAIMAAQQVGKFRTALPVMSISRVKPPLPTEIPEGKLIVASKGGTLLNTVSHDAAILILPNGRRAVLVLTTKDNDNVKILEQFEALAKVVYESLL